MYKKDSSTNPYARDKLLAKLDQSKGPEHVGIIMDGNRRWAKKKGLLRAKGHYRGYQNLKILLDTMVQTHLKVLSLYAFSSKNIYRRNKNEIKDIYKLLSSGLREIFKDPRIEKHNLEVIVSGRRNLLSKNLIKEIEKVEQATFGRGEKILNFCIGYDGHEEIVDATKEICYMVQDRKINVDEINEKIIKNALYSKGKIPEIDLVIRTGAGKGQRISGFMLWDASYAEMMFTQTLWPDFTDKEFLEMLIAFQNPNIQRTFGADIS